MSDWRKDYPILVAESHTIGSLATIRSLGRAGYPVVAASTKVDAIGFHSRYCSKALTHPAYGKGEQFSNWLTETLAKESVRLIIPSEGFLVAVRPRFENLRTLLPVPADERLAYGALSKYDLFRKCADAGLTSNTPPFLLVEEDGTPSLAELKSLGEPLFLKADATYGRNGADGGVFKCDTARQALEKLKDLQSRYSRILVQGFVPGIGVGAFLASWQGQLLGQFMHRRIHEVPHWGGVSSFRESWRHDDILADAQARQACLGWQGVGMFEYRWDPESGRFYLMEFNSRFWGSLHLALYAGVDFPRLLVDALVGRPNPPVLNYGSVKCRLTFPREVEYVYSCLKDRSLPWLRRLMPIAEFAALGMDPRIYSDMSFPGDRRLYGRMMVRSIQQFLRSPEPAQPIARIPTCP